MTQSTTRHDTGSETVATAWSQPADEFDNRFSTPLGALWHKVEVEMITAAAKDLTIPSRLLEVGYGTGRFIEIMARRGHYVFGVEPSFSMISEAEKKVRSFPHVGLTKAEGAVLPFHSNLFDLVYTIRVINHTASREYAFRMVLEMVRVARPGGRVLIEFANRLRPRRRFTGTTLGVRDLERLALNHKSFRIIQIDGILIFSLTLLQYVPRFFLPMWFTVDRQLARRLPRLASRCFVLLQKL